MSIRLGGTAALFATLATLAQDGKSIVAVVSSIQGGLPTTFGNR